MPPVLLCWLTMSVDGMEVEVEPSHQYSITFCCCETDSSRGAIWQMASWHGNALWSKGMELNSSMWKKKWHPLPFIVTFWVFIETKRWMWAQWVSGCAFQWRWQWVTSTGADCYECSMQALVHHWWQYMVVTMLKILLFCSWEHTLIALLSSLL